MQIRSRICPICGREDKKIIFEQNFAYIKGVTFLNKYKVVYCNICGFIFADRIPGQYEFDKYYADSSKYEIVNEEISLEEEKKYDDTINFCNKVLSKENRKLEEMEIVDVGCATGQFLRYMQRKNIGKLFGIDPSKYCIDYLREKNINGIQSTISGITDYRKYDFIRLNSVIEHIVDINSSIEQLKKLLKSTSYIYLSVPNVSEFYKTNNSPYQEFSTEHINYFSVYSLEQLMHKHGFKMCAYKINTNDKYSEIEAVFKLGEGVVKKDTRDEDLSNLLKYIEKNADIENKINMKLKPFIESKEPIIVWGVGTQTLRQLKVGNLGKCNIELFVDSNIHYQNNQYNGIKIISPEKIISNSRILISSYFAQSAIEDYAREKLKLSNKFILLY